MNTSDKKRDIKSGAVEFPQFPGEDCLAHTAKLYIVLRACTLVAVTTRNATWFKVRSTFAKQACRYILP